MKHITRRIVLHFPGFEPLDAQAHRDRYARAAACSAATWSIRIDAGPLEKGPLGMSFRVDAAGPDWRTECRIHLFDHDDLAGALKSKPLLSRLLGGYCAAARVAWHGGLVGYFRHAWRYGAFFVFPFVLIALGLAATLIVASGPFLLGWPAWNLLWSAPLALLAFLKLFLPAVERIHALHLFAHWQLALPLVHLDDAGVNLLLDKYLVAARAALEGPADEYLVTSHSMGSAFAAHVVGTLVEQEPDIFVGKRVVFASLGSTLLQCALLGPAQVLRRRVGAIARCRAIFWLDVQCLSDIVHFYKAKVVSACGFPLLPQARVLMIRFRYMLRQDHYETIKYDLLRMHRQYVLGTEQRAPFDFALMTAGPLPAEEFAGFAADRFAPIGPDGAIEAARQS